MIRALLAIATASTVYLWTHLDNPLHAAISALIGGGACIAAHYLIECRNRKNVSTPPVDDGDGGR